MRSHHQGPQRLVAFAVAVCLTGTSLLPPPARAETAVPLASLHKTLHDVSSILLPEEIGEVREYYAGAGSKAVVLIEDAHAVPDAQESIRKILSFFQKEYGIRLTGIEGASSDLDAQIFRSFPDKKILAQVFSAYARESELTGPTAAALRGEKSARYLGLEDWPLYEKGLGAFLKAAGGEQEALQKIEGLFQELKARQREVYSAELLKADEALERFRKNASDLLTVIKELAVYKTPEQGSELGTLYEGLMRGGESDAGLEQEILTVAETVKRRLQEMNTEEAKRSLQKFEEEFQAFRTSASDAGAFALFLKETAMRHRIKVKVSRALSLRTRHQKKMRDIEGTRLFDEFERYAQDVKESLFRGGGEEELDKVSRQLQVLEKTARLELDRASWDRLKAWTADRASWDVRREETGGMDVFGEVLPLLAPHAEFYRLAEKRDGIFLDRVKQAMENDEAAMIVAGGFHTGGLTRRLKEAGFSYVLVSPKIERLPEENRYREHMQGRVSWMQYFEAENGRIDVSKAFVRAARDKLLEQAGEGRGMLLKNWRDQILRDLAAEDRLDEAAKYTVYLDEASQEMQEKLRERWEASVDDFMARVDKLKASGKFNEQTLLGLFKSGVMVEGALANALAGHAELRVDLLPAAREIKPRAARAKAAAPAAQAPARAEMRPSWEANDLVRSTLAERNKQRAQLLFDFLFEHPLGKTGVVHFQSEQGTAAVFDFAGVEKTPQGQWRVRANRISWMSINEAQQGRTLTSSEFSRFGVALLAALDRQSPDTASKTQIRELLDRLWQLDQKVIQDLTAKKAEFEPQAQATIERNLLTYERARIESQTLVNWALLEPADAPPGFADTDSSGNLVFYPRVEIADSLSTYTGDMGALLSGSSPVRRSVLAAAAAWEKRLTGGAAQAPVPELAEAGTRRIVQDTHAFLNRYFAHFQETLARGARQTKTPLPTAEAFAALTIEQKVGLITTLRAADLERLRQLQQSLDNRLQKIHEGAENLLIIDESVAASVREDRRLEERAYYRPDPGGIFLLPLDPAKDPIPEGAFERPEYPGVLFARFSAYTPEAGDPNVAVVEEHRKQTLALEEKARKRGRELDVLSRSYKTAAAEIKNERARYDLDLAFLEMTPEPVPESPQARAVAAQEAKPAEAKPRGFMGRFLKIFAPLLLLAGLGVGLAVYYFSSPPQEPPAAEQKQEKEKEKKVNERKEEEKAQEPPPPEQNREAEKPKPPEVMPRAQPLHIQEPWSQYTPGVVGGDETSKGLGKKDPNARPVYYFTYSGDAPPHYFFVHQVFKVDPNNPSRWIAVPRNELPELTYKGSGRSSKMTMHVPLPASAEEPTKGLPLPIDARQAGQKPAKDKQVDVEFQLNGRYEGAGQQKGPGFIPVGQAKHLDQVRAKYGLPERDSLRNATPEQLDAAFREIFNRHFKYSSAKASKDYWNAPGAHEKLMETALPAADRFVPGCECSTLSHILGYFLAYYGYHYEILGGYVDADRNGVIGPKEGHAIIRVWMVDPETGAGYYHYMDPVQWVSNTDRWQRELAAAATGDSDIKLFTDYLLENRVAPAVYSFSFLVLAVLGAIVALVLFPYKRYRGLVKLFVKSGYEEGAPGIYNGRVTDAYWKFKYAYGPYKAAVLEHHRKLAESDAAHSVPSEKEIEGWFGQHAAVAVVRAQRAVQGPMAAELPNAPEDGMNLRFVFDGTTLKSVANETGSAEERNQPRKAASGFRHLVRETLRTLRGVLTSGYTWAAARLILLYPLLGTLMFSIAGETLSNLHTALVMLTLPFVMTLDYLWFSHRWFSDDRRDYDTLSWIGAFIGNFLAVTVAAILGTAVVGVSLDGVWSLLGQDKQNELQFFATQNWLSLIATSIKSWAVTIAGFFAAIAIAVAGTYALREYLFRTRYRDYFMRHSFEINPRLLTYSAKFAFTKGIPKGPEVSYGDDAYYTRLANFLAKEPAEGLREYKDPKRLEKDVKYITYAMPLPGNGKYYLHVPEALIKLYPEFPVHAMASIRQSQSPPADGDHEIYYFSRDVKEISKYSGNMKIDGRAVSTTSINPLIASPLGMANTKKPQIAAAVKFLLLVHATNLNGYQAEDGQLFLQNADRLARANPQILRDLGFPETGDLKTQLQEILTLAGRSGLFRLSTLADMPVDKLRERMELASQPFRVIIEPVRRLTLEEVRQYAALRITGYRRGDFEQYGTERKTEILRQIFPLFALEADDGVAFPEAIEVVAEDDPTDIVRVRYADVKGFEKYAPKTPAPAPAALPQPEAPRFSASEEQHHAELRLADTPVPAESLQVMAAGIAPADLKGPLAAVLPQGTTAEHAAEVSFEVLSERNTADVGRQLKESVFAAFLASRETPGPVSTIDAKTARAESAKLLATLASLTHKGYTLGMIPPSESEAAGKKSYFETLIQIARDYGVNEIGTDWKKVPADVYEKLRALGVNPRHLDPRRPFVPLNDQELVPLLVVTQLLEGLDFSKFFMPIRGDVSGIQDPLVVDYTELLKLVAALHLIDLVAADPALLKKPAELQAQLLGRLQLFDQRFQGVITGDADGWGFTVQGKIAQAYLEAMAREAVKQAA